MRHGFNNMKIQEALVNARTQAPDAFSAELVELADEGRHRSMQDFKAEERDVYWICMPSGTYISSLESIKDVRIGGNNTCNNKLKLLLLSVNKYQ